MTDKKTTATLADNVPVKKPRGANYVKSPVIGNNGVHTKPGDNSKYAALAGAIVTWDKIDKKDAVALENRLAQYIQFCIDNDVKPGNLACYAALGINKQTASNWENGLAGTPAQRDFIKKVKLFCAMNREFLMQDGKINPVTGIFWQKNYDGMKDIQDVVLSPANPLGAPTEQKQLEQYIEDKRKGIAFDDDTDGFADD